ncbi:helix-turn-helix transcriptional regulator, partial [Rhodococcus erythropolis]|uniref:helix-turn-helix transcriptional regulator n=1 Tax=Rhodococcus erythropolis TaxID=1833 RepID=UPI0020161B90
MLPSSFPRPEVSTEPRAIQGETFLGDLRTLRLITQSQLAERIGLSQTMMGALERGEINLS